MKKLLLLLAVALMALSCQGPMGPPGEQGPQGPRGLPGEPGAETGWFVKYYTINSQDWIRQGAVNDLNSFFKSPTFTIPELNDFVYNDGTVLAYLEIKGQYQTPLPYTRYNGETDQYGKMLWSELYDYEYTTKSITFYSTTSDFYTENLPPTIVVKVVLLW